MRLRAAIILALIFLAAPTTLFAQQPKLDGAYKLVSVKFPGGGQTEAEVKALIVVNGKHMAFVRASVDRKTWSQDEPQDERTKKIVAAYQGLAATAGTFEIQGTTITLQQVVQANPGSMGTSTKWEYKLDGKTLVLKPAANTNVEFTFERLP